MIPYEPRDLDFILIPTSSTLSDQSGLVASPIEFLHLQRDASLYGDVTTPNSVFTNALQKVLRTGEQYLHRPLEFPHVFLYQPTH